jgi:hypothetical protein
MSDSVALIYDEEKSVGGEGHYLYCVVEIGAEETSGRFGVDEGDVYTVPYGDISAVVHRCPPKPYQSSDNELAKKWLLQHQEVVNFFFDRYDAVLPFAFDTIIRGNEGEGDGKVRNWLKEEYSKLKMKMDKVRGKQEFGVQIFWDQKSMSDELRKESDDVRRMLAEIASRPRGLAYMYEQKLKGVMRRELEARAEKCCREFYDAIRSHVNDVRLEKNSNAQGDKQMIMNLSCLVQKERTRELGRELDRINSSPNISVRFTGPWPPYSFMT